MRARLIVVALAILAPPLAVAADLDRPHASRRVRVDAYASYAEVRLPPPPRPIVVAPRATVLVIPPQGPRPRLLYAPPPVPNPPPPLITALPIIGPYLVLPDDEPPPATVLDAYDHRYDYNQ